MSITQKTELLGRIVTEFLQNEGEADVKMIRFYQNSNLGKVSYLPICFPSRVNNCSQA